MSIHVASSKPEAATPPATESEAAKPHQHRMAQEQGSAYTTAATHMVEIVAQTGLEAHAGEMIVAIAIEKAEGMYQLENGSLTWKEPGAENAHVEVSVRDAADNRFLPGLDVRVEVFDDQGSKVAGATLPYLWHPWLYHYGSNVELPGAGTYSISVDVAVPTFARHDKENGHRFTSDVHVEFAGVEIETGKA